MKYPDIDIQIKYLNKLIDADTHKEHSSLSNLIAERTMFFKMQNVAAFESLRISTAVKRFF